MIFAKQCDDEIVEVYAHVNRNLAALKIIAEAVIDTMPVAARNLDQACALRAERETALDLSVGGENHDVEPVLEHIHEFPFADRWRCGRT